MRKGCLYLGLLSAVLSMALIGCGQENTSSTDEKLTTTVSQSGTEEETETKTDDVAETSEQEFVSEEDLELLKMQLEIAKTKNSQFKKNIEDYQNMEQGFGTEELQELVQSELLKCYEENTLLAVEMKTLIMGSFGVEVPSGFASGDSVTEKYEDYITSTVVDGVLSEIASEDVQELLKNGIDGAVEAYNANGTLEEVLNGALSSTVDGVVAKIQEVPSNMVLGILDETTGGLSSVAVGILQSNSPEEYLMNKADEELGGVIGSISSIVNYDATPTTFLQSLSNSATASANKVKEFINKDSVTSDDIAQAMYQYSQFGNTLDRLSQYGGTTSFLWENNYAKMEILYARFVRNETMIEMLKAQEGKETAAVQKEEITEQTTAQVADGETAESESTEGESAESESIESETAGSDTEMEYQKLEAELAKIKQENEEMQQQIEQGSELLQPLKKYYKQVKTVETACKDTVQYSIDNFQVEYDMEGTQWMQENNQIANAAAEISKFTPWGITVNIFAACSIDSSQKYYSAMVELNDKITEAYQPVIVDTKKSIETLNARYNFYNELVDTSLELEEQYRNMYLLSYIQNGQDISFESEIQAVYENIYILAKQFKASGELYSSIYLDKSLYNEFMSKHDELLSLIRYSSVTQVEENLSTEKMASYMMPVLEAGKEAVYTMENLPQAPKRDNAFVNLYPRQLHSGRGTRVSYCKIDGRVVHVDGAGLNIYYTNEPFYISGIYVYDGRALNGTANTDAATLLEEAAYFRNIKEKDVQDNYYTHATNLFNAKGE